MPCSGKGHRVRLRGGLRFFKAAACPTCRAPVDPARWRRLVRFAGGLRHPVSRHPLDWSTWAMTSAFVAATILGVALFRVAADLWWPATVLLFAPRWVALVPIVPLAGLALLRDRALLVPLALAALILAGPFLGLRLGWPGVPFPSDEEDVTIATLNAAGGANLLYGPELLMDRLGADILVLQECAGSYRNELIRMEAAYTASSESLCIASRYPILGTAVMDRDAIRQAGGAAFVATHVIDVRGRPIRVTNVHLETPREGLELILGGRVREGAEVLRNKSFLREIELRRAESWAEEQGGPALVLGDLNTPPESRHMRRIWTNWTDAFARVGFGIGGTRLSGWIRARIDYVMADDAWTVVRAEVGEPVGSDHLPVIARVRLRD